LRAEVGRRNGSRLLLLSRLLLGTLNKDDAEHE